MKKALFKIIIPVCVLVLWMITCYPVCNKADGFDYFLYWILVGCPYGIRKMCMFLVPKNFGIAGSMGILALNCIVGGLIGGIIVLVRIIVIFTEIIKVIAGHFWTQCQSFCNAEGFEVRNGTEESGGNRACLSDSRPLYQHTGNRQRL